MITIKKGDLLPKLSATIRDASGAVDLTDCSALFEFTHLESGTTKNAAAVVQPLQTTTDKGKVVYSWATGDTDLAGDYRGRFLITFDGGKVMTSPSEGFIDFRIDETDEQIVLVNPYCTLAELRLELKNSQQKDKTTEAMILAINDASRWVDRKMNQDYFEHVFATDEAALKFDQFDDCVINEEIFLPYRPVISITEVKLGDAVLVAESDYVAKEYKLISLNGCWNLSRVFRRLVVKGRFGYSQTVDDELQTWRVPQGVPAFVRTAARLAAASLSGYNRKEVIGIDGTKTDFIDRTIPKTAYDLLGAIPPVVM